MEPDANEAAAMLVARCRERGGATASNGCAGYDFAPPGAATGDLHPGRRVAEELPNAERCRRGPPGVVVFSGRKYLFSL